jgi:hypothetical protein
MKGAQPETPPTPPRDGVRSLRAAQTEVERRLWRRLRNRQLNGTKFRRQHPIDPYIADFPVLMPGLWSSLTVVSIPNEQCNTSTSAAPNTWRAGAVGCCVSGMRR